MTKTIAIMQPTFLPWIGYFGMIEQSEKFVFLDSVQFAKRSWQQRNRLKSPKGELLVTVPVLNKGLSEQLINEVKINPDETFSKKFINSLTANYAKAPFFKNYISEITAILENEKNSLCELNIKLITWAMSILSISTDKLMRSSEMKATGKKADLLLHICQELQATKYISAPGSKDYLEEASIFEKNGVQIIYHAYEHPTYPQLHGDFLSHLGILDLIFNCGPSSREIMLKGLK
jgi:hypothetical protein